MALFVTQKPKPVMHKLILSVSHPKQGATFVIFTVFIKEINITTGRGGSTMPAKGGYLFQLRICSKEYYYAAASSHLSCDYSKTRR